MAAPIINSLNGYTLQDARFDNIGYGIEVRDNTLGLINGGYFEDRTLFELTEQSIQLDNDRYSSYEYTISGIDSNMLDWITGGNDVEILIAGEYVDETNGTTSTYVYRSLVRGYFSADTSNQEHYTFNSDNDGIYVGNFSEVYIDITDSDNPVFTISKDTRLSRVFTLSEVAVYLKGFEPITFPADLVDIDGIYTAIVDKLINDGYIQSQPQILTQLRFSVQLPY